MAPILNWNPAGRAVVFALAATSIACLLVEFYAVCPMRVFAVWVLLPAMVLLGVLAAADYRRGDRRLYRGIMLGVVAGLLAALAYDVFRLPFVMSREWGLTAVVPPMPLFKVFPGFGAMLLNEPVDQPRYSAAATVLGWVYHFSNGAMFGVMYTAMVGDPRRRSWMWAIVMAVGIEVGMLLSPYTSFFSIPMTGLFVAVTLTAHTIFGVVLGLWARWRGLERSL